MLLAVANTAVDSNHKIMCLLVSSLSSSNVPALFFPPQCRHAFFALFPSCCSGAPLCCGLFFRTLRGVAVGLLGSSRGEPNTKQGALLLLLLLLLLLRICLQIRQTSQHRSHLPHLHFPFHALLNRASRSSNPGLITCSAPHSSIAAADGTVAYAAAPPSRTRS